MLTLHLINTTKEHVRKVVKKNAGKQTQNRLLSWLNVANKPLSKEHFIHPMQLFSLKFVHLTVYTANSLLKTSVKFVTMNSYFLFISSFSRLRLKKCWSWSIHGSVVQLSLIWQIVERQTSLKPSPSLPGWAMVQPLSKLFYRSSSLMYFSFSSLVTTASFSSLIW